MKDYSSVARLKARRDELKAKGVNTGVVGKLTRLISKMERPSIRSGPLPASWFATEKDMKGKATIPRPAKQEETKGRLKASQRRQMEAGRR